MAEKQLPLYADTTQRPVLLLGASSYVFDASVIPFIPCANSIPMKKALESSYTVRLAVSMGGQEAWQIRADLQSSYPFSHRVFGGIQALYDVLERNTVRASVAAPYGVQVAGAVSGSHEVTTFLKTALASLYDVGTPDIVRAAVASPYPIKVAAHVEGLYTSTVSVRKALQSPYGVLDRDKVSAFLSAPYPIKLTGSFESDYRTTTIVKKRQGMTAPHVNVVLGGVEARYDIVAYNRVRAGIKGIYHATKTTSVSAAPITLKIL